MPVKLKIKVTKEVLERSKYCNKDRNGNVLVPALGGHCAIAVAVRDLFPNAYVSKYKIFFDGLRASSPTAWLPSIASGFIDDFDMATPNERVALREIEFEIEVPEEIVERTNIDELKPLLENHPTLELCS